MFNKILFLFRTGDNVNQIEEEASSFRVSVESWLFNLLVSGVEASNDDTAISEHTKHYIQTMNSFEKKRSEYQGLKVRTKDREKIIQLAIYWREYWELWFESTLNTYNPDELARLYTERKNIEKKIKSF